MSWGSERWSRVYSRGRALVEGENGRVKHPDGRDLRRWVVGSSYLEAVALAVALDKALENLRAVRSWIAACPDDEVSQQFTADPLFATDEKLSSCFTDVVAGAQDRDRAVSPDAPTGR